MYQALIEGIERKGSAQLISIKVGSKLFIKAVRSTYFEGLITSTEFLTKLDLFQIKIKNSTG